MRNNSETVQAIKVFGLPLLAALLLHTVVVLLVFGTWQVRAPQAPDPFDIPNYIRAEVVTIEKPKPAPKPVAQPKPKPKPVTKPQPKPQPKPAPSPKPTPKPEVKPVVAPVADADVVVAPESKPEPEPEALPETAPVESSPQTEPEPETSFEDLLAGLAAEEQAISDQIDQITQSQQREAEIQLEVEDYTRAITRQIEQKWSRPPELRLKDLQGVEARVLVEILPTGELQQVSITKSSGNVNYDQSVLRAIEKVRRFEVPQDPEVFDRGGFRRLNIIFRPEDLMTP